MIKTKEEKYNSTIFRGEKHGKNNRWKSTCKNDTRQLKK